MAMTIKSIEINNINNSKKAPVGIKNAVKNLNASDTIRLLLLFSRKSLKTDIPLIIAFVLAFPNHKKARRKTE